MPFYNTYFYFLAFLRLKTKIRRLVFNEKNILILLIAITALFCMSGCDNNNKNNKIDAEPSAEIIEEKNDDSNLTSSDKRLDIVASIFPAYDWVKEVLGDNINNTELTLLLDNGVDLHNYQPTVDDVVKISECDVFIYVGGESDKWAEDVLKTATNKDMKVINLMESLGNSVKTEELVEGMQESKHSHSHDESFTAEEIEDRTLEDFKGEWSSLYPLLLNGDLDSYCEHKAEEDEDSTATKEDYIEKYKKSWACNANNISIDGNIITFVFEDGTSQSGEYDYAGYNIKTSDAGKISVRYQFKTENDNVPKYVQFNDHGYKPGKSEHFHIYFGNDSFEDLINSETNPYFMPANLSLHEMLEELIGHGGHCSHGSEEETDEHVWLSLKNAQVLCQTISDNLAQADPANKDLYLENAKAYITKLDNLDKQYKEAIEGSDNKTLLFGDRFPFRYLVDDYNLSYYAAFSGCSAETEASFETISFLSEKVDELKLNSVLTIDGRNHKIAETIISNTQTKDQNVLTLDSMQSTTSNDAQNGVTYLSVMEENLSVLKDALN